MADKENEELCYMHRVWLRQSEDGATRVLSDEEAEEVERKYKERMDKQAGE